MIILGIDTSTPVGTIALSRDGKPFAKKTLTKDSEHSSTLLPGTEKILSENNLSADDLDAVAVGTGPGSYTGVRVGIAFAKGIAYGIQKPVAGVCSFESMALAHSDFKGDICTFIDAKMGGIYWAVYRLEKGKLTEIHPPKVTSPTEFIFDTGMRTLFISSDMDRYEKMLAEHFSAKTSAEYLRDYPDAGFIAIRGEERILEEPGGDYGKLEPYYLRPSMAEITRISRADEK